MNGHRASSPFIKNEPDDFSFSPNRFIKDMNGVTYPNGQAFGPWQSNSLDPLELSLSNQTSQPALGSSQNMSSSFIAGNSAITDDDLLESFGTSPSNNQGDVHMNNHARNGMSQFQSNQGFHNGMQQSMHPPTSGSGSAFNAYSSTPDGAPIQSPFDHGFDYNQWASAPSVVNQQNRGMSTSSMTPNERPRSYSKGSMTPGMGSLQIGSQENHGMFQGQAINGHPIQRAHQQSVSSAWDSSLGSGYSALDSPMASPNGPMRPPISEVLKSGTPSSPPLGHPRTASKPTSSAELKKAKRRASHNEVERRRRNHINDQIANLSRLVPQHRLDDDAIRRALNSNSSLPPSIHGNGVSPPPATSLLAGPNGRRATGSISQGLPLDDKDKNPAKGDVLNGAVGWLQDLLWVINKLTSREKLLTETIEGMGGQSPLTVSDEESRMLSEVQAAFEKSQIGQLKYSRGQGSGLCVPGFTDQAGQTMQSPSQTAVDPANFSLDRNPHVNGNGHNNGGLNDGQQYWTFPGDNNSMQSPAEFKEEDEFELDMS